MEMSLTPEQAMIMAIEEGKKGIGSVSPNPPVGCVILDHEMRLLSVGYHKACGSDHAEIDALKKIQDRSKLKGAHIYVTLEPCAHQGRTPSCARELAKWPLASVVFGLVDPNPKVAGQGATIVNQAGIRVEQFSGLSAELEELAEVFLYNMKRRRPFVSIKVATSLDGQMALASGESQWITGEKAREHAHFLRASHDSVLVGASTFLADNPSLNVRHPRFSGKANKGILIDPTGRCLAALPGSNLRQTHSPGEIFIISSGIQSAHLTEGYQIISVPRGDDGRLDLGRGLDQLYERGICSILVEGGANTFRDFVLKRYASRLFVYLAPSLIGGANGMSWTPWLQVSDLEQRVVLRNTKILSLGADSLITGLLPQ